MVSFGDCVDAADNEIHSVTFWVGVVSDDFVIESTATETVLIDRVHPAPPLFLRTK